MARVFSSTYNYIVTPKQADACAGAMVSEQPDVIGVDTETTGLSCMKDRLKLVQVAVKGKPVNIFEVDKIGDDPKLRKL